MVPIPGYMKTPTPTTIISIVPGDIIIPDRIGYKVIVTTGYINHQALAPVTCDRIVLYDRTGTLNIETRIRIMGTVFKRVALYQCFTTILDKHHSTVYNIVFY